MLEWNRRAHLPDRFPCGLADLAPFRRSGGCREINVPYTPSLLMNGEPHGAMRATLCNCAITLNDLSPLDQTFLAVWRCRPVTRFSPPLLCSERGLGGEVSFERCQGMRAVSASSSSKAAAHPVPVARAGPGAKPGLCVRRPGQGWPVMVRQRPPQPGRFARQ